MVYLFLSVFISPLALNKSRSLLSNDELNSLGPIIKSNQFSDSFEGLTFVVDKKNGNEIKNILQNEIENKSKNIININKTNFEECKQLFNVFGIPWIIANGEAENICSQLCFYKLNINTDYSVMGCLSNDSDVLVNGGRKLLTNFSSYTNTIVEYDLEIILRDMNLSYEQFVDMSILCGCDYLFDSQNNKHIKIDNIGPINVQ